MFKKIISLILCFALVFSLAFAEGEEQIKDEWLRSAEILSSLELLDDYNPENFGFNSEVSRAEFVDTFANFYIDYPINISTGYSDVPKEHWAASSIAIAKEMNLISPAANFEPDKEINLNEALKIAVCSLGYGTVAEQSGGYPAGHLNYAARLGLMKNLGGGNFTRADMITLMYNMLDAEVMEVDFGRPGEAFKTGDKLLKVLGYKKLDGVVVANNVVSINGAALTYENEIQINDIVVVYENSMNLIGRRVNCFYHIDSDIDEYRAVYIECIDDGVLKVNTDDISRLTSTTLYYDDGGIKIQEADISSKAEIIYNGRRETSLPESLLVPQVGWIELADYNSDGIYDVLFINSFEEYVVGNYNSADGMIYDKIDRARYVDVSGNYKRLEVYINGEPSTLNNLPQNSLVSVAKSRDNEVLVVYASTQIISAKATEYGDDYIILDDEKYEFTKSFVANSFYDVSFKNFNNYYINYFGRISYAKVSSSKLYGYMLAAGPETDISANMLVKLLDNEGVVKIYKTANKVKINGTNVNASSLISNALLFPTKDEENKPVFKPQLCTYSLDSEGNLKTINVEGANLDTENELVSVKDSTNTPISTIGFNTYKTSSIMNNRYVFTALTKVFVVASEEKNMTVTSPAGLAAEASYSGLMYDWKDGVINAMVVFDDASESVNDEAAPIVISEVIKAIDEETGEEIVKIYAYQNGVLVDMYSESLETESKIQGTLPAFNNFMFTNLKKGDVLQTVTNFSGRISNFRLLFGMDRGMAGETEITYHNGVCKVLSNNLGNKYAKMYVLHGQITDIYSDSLFKVNTAKGTGLNIGANKVEDYDRILQMAGGKVYLYNTEKDEVSVISPSEIMIDDMVYARTRYTLTEEIYVVR